MTSAICIPNDDRDAPGHDPSDIRLSKMAQILQSIDEATLIRQHTFNRLAALVMSGDYPAAREALLRVGRKYGLDISLLVGGREDRDLGNLKLRDYRKRKPKEVSAITFGRI